MLEVTYPHCLLGFRLLLAVFITAVSYMVVVMVIADLRAPVVPPPRPGIEVPSWKYTVVLDLNGVLLHRTYDHSKFSKVIFIKIRQNHNFETWRIEGECFQESLIIPFNSTSSNSHLRQR